MDYGDDLFFVWSFVFVYGHLH